MASEKIFGGPMGFLVAVQVIFQRESEFADFAFVRSSVSLLVAAKGGVSSRLRNNKIKAISTYGAYEW